jgi:hypothetical protein
MISRPIRFCCFQYPFGFHPHCGQTAPPPTTFQHRPSQLELIHSGCRLWVDLTHWYFGVYLDPFESVSNFWARHAAEWQKSATSAGHVWAFFPGSLPKASLTSVLFASGELISARSLPLAQRLRIIRWVNHLWFGCDFTGHAPTSQAGLAFSITSGTVDAKVSWQLKHSF